MLRRNILNEIKNKKHFLLVRHGQSIWNHDSKFTGWTNIPLTSEGKKEAQQIANTLKNKNLHPNIIFSSVLHRAIDTSNIIKKELNHPQINIHTSWRLNEKHYGTLEGIPRQFIRDVYGDKFTKMMRGNFNMKPPVLKNDDLEQIPKLNLTYQIYKNCYFDKIKNGESKENVLERLLPYFQNDICYTFQEYKFPLIITHKHCARVLMKYLLNINDEDFEYFEIPNKTIIHVDLDNNLNYKSHYFIKY